MRLHAIVGARVLVAMVVAAGVAVWGLHLYPVQTANPFLGLIQLERPFVFQVLAYGYATLWLTTPFLAASLVTSLLAIIVYRYPQTHGHARFPRIHRLSPDLPQRSCWARRIPASIGASADARMADDSAAWLYTGVMNSGRGRSGKTSACMYPYVQQLLRWRAQDPAQKLGGLVLEVKGDFCSQVRRVLAAANRDADYLEVGLNTGVCYNPLHNDLDPYTVAYATGQSFLRVTL